MDWVCSGLVADWGAISGVVTAIIAGLAYVFARGEVKRHRLLRGRDAAVILMERGLSLVSANIRLIRVLDQPSPVARDVGRETQVRQDGILDWVVDSQRLGVYFDDGSAEARIVSRISKRFVVELDAAKESMNRRRNSELAAWLRVELGPFVRGPNRKEWFAINLVGTVLAISGAERRKQRSHRSSEPGTDGRDDDAP